MNDTVDYNLSKIRLGLHRFLTPEILFHPSLAGIDSAGITEAVIAATDKCSSKMRDLLLSGVMLVGGLSELRGLKQRLEAELSSCAEREFDSDVRV